MFLNAPDSLDHPLISGARKFEGDQEERTGIQFLTPIRLDKTFALFIPSVCHNLFVNLSAELPPRVDGSGKAALACQPQSTIKGHPVHHA